MVWRMGHILQSLCKVHIWHQDAIFLRLLCDVAKRRCTLREAVLAARQSGNTAHMHLCDIASTQSNEAGSGVLCFAIPGGGIVLYACGIR